MRANPFRWYRTRPIGFPASIRRPTVKVLHSFYRSEQPSGENETVLEQVELLAKSEFDVELIYMSSDDLESKYSAKLLTAVGLTTGTPTAEAPTEWFAGADILHIHNTFPEMSHQWLSTLDIPKVMTIHNYRAFCANALFLRDGQRCMDCTTQGPWKAVIHGCYRNSRVQSIPIVMQQRSSRSLTQLMNRCYRVLLPGAPMQDTFRGLGVTNTQVLANPVTTTFDQSEASLKGNAWLFAGRISPEKGLVELLRVWPLSQSLIVVGDGPDRQKAEDIARERGLSAKFLGRQDSQEVRSLMRGSHALIFPSRALEGAPLVYGEAMEAGLPLVAAEGSTLATQTMADQTGTAFTWGNPSALMTALDFVAQNRTELAHRAREIYQRRYTPEAWLNNLTRIYQATMSAQPPR